MHASTTDHWLHSILSNKCDSPKFVRKKNAKIQEYNGKTCLVVAKLWDKIQTEFIFDVINQQKIFAQRIKWPTNHVSISYETMVEYEMEMKKHSNEKASQVFRFSPSQRFVLVNMFSVLFHLIIYFVVGSPETLLIQIRCDPSPMVLGIPWAVDVFGNK